MTAGFCRVTVLAPRHRVDLSVPADLTCAEILPELLRLSGEQDSGLWPRTWLLSRLGGHPLPPDRSLAESGVVDGDILCLTTAQDPVPPPVVHDAAEAVAESVDTRPGQWGSEQRRRLLLTVGAAWVAASVLVPLAAGLLPRWGGAVAFALALGFGAAAGALWHLRQERLVSMASGLVALPFWVAGVLGLLVLREGASASTVVTAAALSLGAGSAALAILVPPLAPVAVAIVLAGLSLAVWGGGVLLLGATPVQMAAVLTLAWTGLVSLLPRLAMRLAGLAAHEADDEGWERAAAGQGDQVSAGHRFLSWLLAAAAVSLAPALVLLASDGGGFARWLAAAGALAIVLRARSFRFTSQVLPLALAGLAGLASLEASLVAENLDGGAGPAAGLALVLLTGLALAGAGMLPTPQQETAAISSSRRLQHLDTAVNLAMVPLCLGVLGVYQLVTDLARGLS